VWAVVLSLCLLGLFGAQGSPAAASANSPIRETLHGGPIVAGDVDLHIVFWESHAVDASYDQYIERFFNDLSNSSLMETLQGYLGKGIDGSPAGFPGPSVTVAGVWHDTKSPLPTGKMESASAEAAVLKELNRAIDVNRWPTTAGNVFMIFTGPGYQTTLLSGECGWHTAGRDSSGTEVPYAFIPRPGLPSCAASLRSGYINPTPSGSARHDAAVTIAWHEFVEMLTDPVPLTGYDDASRGPQGEVADVCSETFPGLAGSNHNDVTLDGHDYLVQGVWDR
jgi:hypothetical protein